MKKVEYYKVISNNCETVVLEAIEQTSACRILVLLMKEAYPVSEIIRKVGVSQQAVYNALR
ncbi:MAG: hypothetical protein QW279_11590, partial [Candidatus Jordarchaeaceae archaeon]